MAARTAAVVSFVGSLTQRFRLTRKMLHAKDLENLNSTTCTLISEGGEVQDTSNQRRQFAVHAPRPKSGDLALLAQLEVSRGERADNGDLNSAQ